MILGARDRSLVLLGRKTMHRLSVHDPRIVTRRNGTTYESRPTRPRPGVLLDVHPAPGRPAQFRVAVTDVRFEMLGAIDFQDARAEGFRSVADFKRSWLHEHDQAWILEQGDVDDERVAARFHRRFDGKPVWVVSFRLDVEHEARLLAAADMARPTDLPEESATARGYTNSPARAMRGNPGEAISPALLEVYTEDARQRHSGRPGRREEQIRRRMKTLAHRAVRLGAEGVDVSQELDRLEQHLDVLEQQRKAA